MSSSPVQPPSDFAEFPRSALEGSLARRFRERAVRFPDAIAVKSGRDSLTYSQLDLASDALARDLIEKDGRDPLPIGTWMAPGCELVTAALAILKAGKIWVPIDPAYPQARAEWMLRDSGARLRLDSVDLGSARASDAIDLGGPDAIAYILYTSGSTGEPRGVFQNHRNVLHSIRAHANALKISPSDRLTLLASCSHLAGVTAIFRALLCGARVLPYDLKKDGVAGLAEWIEREGVTLYQSVPLVFRHLVETLRPARRLQGVRLVHLGGETVLRRDVESFRRHFSENAVLLNNLGSTEVFTYRQLFITRGTPLPDETVPVGDAVEEKDVTLRDEDGRRVPAGAAGEIWVSSPYLAPGYWNRPDWTAEKFLSDPERPGWRIFKTGDLGRILPDGRLAHLGRKDSQVKIRGHRLELDEVARALLRHPAIEDQAVLAAGSGEHDRVLLAFVVLKTGGALTAAALRSFLGERLPDFMVPSVLEFLESLPRTPNGKVDRQALLARPRRSESRDVLSGAFRDAPLDDREEKVLGAFREILGPQGGPQVGPLDEFLEIGGDSLSASRIVALLNETFSVRLPLSFLFEHSTARRVSNALEAQPRSAASANPTSAGTRDEGPLSLSQQRLWLLHQLDPASSVYHLAKAARIHGPLDRRALENALAEVRRRHAILRTIFPSRDGQPYQKVLEPGPPLTFVEFESSESAHDDRVDSWMRDHFAAPFDLALGPLFRAAILSAGPEDHVLLLTMHHLVADGWSMSVLWRELSLLYEAFSSGRASPLPELPLQVLDCAIAQRAEVESHAMRAQLEVWRRRLADPPAALELPFDHPRSTGSHFAGAREPLRVSGDLLKRLQTLATQNGSTLYMVLLAAFQSFLHRYTDQDDVLIGSPVSGRPAGCEELVGFFVNTLVLRADFSRDPSFRDAIRQARARALEAFSNADAPFEKIVEILRPERDLGRTPLFQAMFALQNTPPAVLELSGLRVTPLTTPHPAAMFDLTLSLRLSGEELDGYLEYGSDRFERDTVRRLGAAFVEFLRDASESPDLKLAELLPGRRERQTLAEWNSTRAEFPAASYPELFRRQAAETPNAAAVAFRGRMLSYHALDDASDELARELVERGVGPETPVGVCLERSLELAIALLAILKAGGAYLPLDPQYPRERLAFMIENSGARLALTATGPASALPQSVPRRYVDHPAPWKSPGVRLPEVSPDALAYLIYTSGSTGRPKGVAIEHRALVNHNLAIGRAYQLGPADRVLQFASLSFDISVEEIFATWLAGATLVMRTEECVRSMPDFFEFLKAEEITVLNAPTAFWHEMAPSLGQLSLPAALRLVVIGGEKASEVHYKTWRGRVPQRVRLLNAYGPTEATVTATVFAPGKGAPERLPIGRPIANTQAHVLDRRGRVLPVGAAGEICIGGAGLARGYWREPKLTAEKFVAKGGSGERVYRTGDRGRFLPDGNLEFLGRIDEQVKIRGFRIEPGEIETVLLRQDGVQEAVVVARTDSRGDDTLAAYVVARGLRAEALREILRQRLPDYLVPATIAVLPELPRLPNGKVDRKRLPEQPTAAAPTGRVPPRNEPERGLLEIWKRVLKQDRLGVTDNFFDLGGHSLLAIRLLSEIQRDLGSTLPLTAIFQAPTVEKFAQLLIDSENSDEAAVLPLQPKGRRPPLFWLHTLGGGGAGGFFRYKKLAELLSPDQPSYGIRAPREPYSELPAMAADYLRKIRKVQPSGPYRLAGYCFGGNLAFEMARQLGAGGEAVDFLGLLECVALPGRSVFARGTLDRPGLKALADISMNTFYWARDLHHQGWRASIERMRDAARRFRSKSRPLEEADADVREVLERWDYPKAFRKHAEAHWRAISRYQPAPYDGSAVLFRVRKQRLKHFDRALGWGDFLRGGVEVRIVSGKHDSIFDEPHVRELAASLQACLDKLA